MSFETWTLIFSALLGLIVGSFANVVIARHPLGLSLLRPGSRCPKCESAIRWFDNIPVVSWLLLRGRCRRCEQPISPRYPVVELITALLFVAVERRFGWSPLLLVREFPLIVILVSVTFIDLDHRIIPDELSLGGLALGLLTAYWTPELGLVQSLIGATVGFASFYLLATAYSHFSGKTGLGGGDVKLLAMIGAFTGAEGVLATVLISSIVGSVVGIGWGLFSGKRQLMGLAIPYGPFLVLGVLCYILFGGSPWFRFMIPM